MSNNALSTQSAADKIASRINPEATENLGIARGGALDFLNLGQIMEVAKVVAIAKQAIPPHLRDNVGACLAVCIQSSEWKMSPFAVANKSYVVNDRMAYEAQLVAAVILMRAPIKGRLKYKHTGEGPTRQCTCSAVCEDGETVEYTTPEIGKIRVKNSPLWNNDPDQQLCYYAARSLARRHFPDVILGVYTPDEMAELTEREVTPPKPSVAIDPLSAALAALPPDPIGAPKPQAVPTDTMKPPRPTPKPQPITAPVDDTPAPVIQPEPEPQPMSAGSAVEDPEAVRLAGVTAVTKLLNDAQLSMGTFKAKCVELGITESSTMLSKMTTDQLQAVQSRWAEFTGEAQQSATAE